MRNQLRVNQSFGDKLAVFFLFCGVLAGTVWVNLREPEPELSFRLLVSVAAFQSGKKAFASLLLKRLFWLGFLWMLGLSKLALSGICLFFFCSGISLSLVLAELTMQYGVYALLFFLAMVLPQCFFYLPVLSVLTNWALKGTETLHLSGMLVLFFLTLAGAAAEAYGNPQLLEWLGTWMC